MVFLPLCVKIFITLQKIRNEKEPPMLLPCPSLLPHTCRCRHWRWLRQSLLLLNAVPELVFQLTVAMLAILLLFVLNFWSSCQWKCTDMPAQVCRFVWHMCDFCHFNSSTCMHMVYGWVSLKLCWSEHVLKWATFNYLINYTFAH